MSRASRITAARTSVSSASTNTSGPSFIRRLCAASTEREHTSVHTTCIMEKAAKLRHAEGGEQIVWITNFDGACGCGFASVLLNVVVTVAGWFVIAPCCEIFARCVCP